MILEGAGAQFVSKASSAGIVHVELGFVPDFAILISAHGATNPNIYIWCNVAAFSQWAAALSLLITGSSGVITRDTTGIAVYNGADTVAAAETADTDPKHVNQEGTAAAAGHITAPGVTIPADHQTASGNNILIAFRLRSTN